MVGLGREIDETDFVHWIIPAGTALTLMAFNRGSRVTGDRTYIQIIWINLQRIFTKILVFSSVIAVVARALLLVQVWKEGGKEVEIFRWFVLGECTTGNIH